MSELMKFDINSPCPVCKSRPKQAAISEAIKRVAEKGITPVDIQSELPSAEVFTDVPHEMKARTIKITLPEQVYHHTDGKMYFPVLKTLRKPAIVRKGQSLNGIICSVDTPMLDEEGNQAFTNGTELDLPATLLAGPIVDQQITQMERTCRLCGAQWMEEIER